MTTEDATAPLKELVNAVNKMVYKWDEQNYSTANLDAEITTVAAVLANYLNAERRRPAPAPVEVDDLARECKAHAADKRIHWATRGVLDRAAAEITALRERVMEVSQERDAEYDLRRNTNALLKGAIARAEAAEADAARYRWLRVNNHSPALFGVADLLKRAEYLDAAIDAAMSERK
jgi:hypothetical protein